MLRRSSLAQRWVHVPNAMHLKEIEFNVVVFSPDSQYWPDIVTMKSLKNIIPQLHARDIVSLGLSLEQKSRVHVKHVRRTPNVLIPRDDMILASFGGIKLIVQPHRLIIFEPQLPVVKSWIEHLSHGLTGFKGCFELYILEDLFRELCDSFDRRIALYCSLLNSIIDEEQNNKEDLEESVFKYSLVSNLFLEERSTMNRRSENHIYKLSPLTDILYEFELELKDAQRCIVDMLKDKNMEKLNISAQIEARSKNIPYDPLEHDEAELLLENYALRLVSSVTDAMHLQQKVRTQVALADMGMKTRRNRLLALNVNMGAVSSVNSHVIIGDNRLWYSL